MASSRFSKARALEVLDAKADAIANLEKFDRSHGTRQISPHEKDDALVRRAVEYGRMRAFEEFSCAIEENFAFDRLTKGGA